MTILTTLTAAISSVFLSQYSMIGNASDHFATYEKQWNAKTPAMPILTGKAKKLYTKLGGSIGTIRFDNRRWLGDVGLARYTLTSTPKSYKGWMAFEKAFDGQIKGIAWTKAQPPKIDKGLVPVAGQIGDAGTTAAALSQGFVEANPLMAGAAGPFIAGAKIIGVQWARGHSLDSCINVTRPAAITGWAATLLNAAVMAGQFTPLAIVPALGIAYAISPDANEAFWSCIPKPLTKWASNS